MGGQHRADGKAGVATKTQGTRGSHEAETAKESYGSPGMLGVAGRPGRPGRPMKAGRPERLGQAACCRDQRVQKDPFSRRPKEARRQAWPRGLPPPTSILSHLLGQAENG